MSEYRRDQVLGPIRFNIYTQPLYNLCRRNEMMSGFYADDSQVYIVCNISDLNNSILDLENCVLDLQSWMSSNRLKLNGDKTELTVFASPRIGKQLPPVQLVIEEAQISPQASCRNLGSFFDQHMSMTNHVNNVCKISYFHLSQIASIRPLLDVKTTESLIHAFISSRLDYCNSLLYGISASNLSKLQKVQNKAARICLKVSRKAKISSSSLLQRLHWLPVSFRLDYKILLITYKALNDLAPQYLAELLHHRCIERVTRSTSLNLLVIPKTRTKSFGDRAFEVVAPRLWNDLPLYMRQIESVAGFKKVLKTYLFRKAFHV